MKEKQIETIDEFIQDDLAHNNEDVAFEETKEKKFEDEKKKEVKPA